MKSSCTTHSFLGMVPRKYVRFALRAMGLLFLAAVATVAVSRVGSVKDHIGHLSGNTKFSAGNRPDEDGGEDGGLVENAFSVLPRHRVQDAADADPNAADGVSRRRGRKKSHKPRLMGALSPAATGPGMSASIRPLDIHVNQEYHVKGLYMVEEKEAYLPFKFVRKYFDIYGDVKASSSSSSVSSEGKMRLTFSHSYGRPFSPPKTYTHHAAGAFLNFGTFNVAGRERVLYMDEYDVPVSTQWDPKGYHFATQISQYGLQHYSNLVHPKNSTVIQWIVNPEESPAVGNWTVRERTGNTLKVARDSELGQDVLAFCTEVAPTGIRAGVGITYPVAKFSAPTLRVVSAGFKMTGDALCLSFQVLMTDKTVYTVHYDTTATKTLEVLGEAFRYRLLAKKGQWRVFARDLQIDIQRAVVFEIRKKDSTKPMRESASASVKVVRVQSLAVRGCGVFSNLSLRSDAHLTMTMAAVDWLLLNQDSKTGGWPTHAVRTLKPNLVLQPGWLSAMVQGQAMSLLVRAYSATKIKKYLDAALKATQPFLKLAKDGGVKAIFLNEYTWYEEYPTQPSSFVLNGFIFSLLGLHDLAEAAKQAGIQSNAEELYKAGVRSLRAMAMLYDTGVGTIYDLRHFSIPTFPPNRARWDYHVTHINLMTAMATIDEHPMFKTLRERWLGYMTGRATKHN